MHLVIPIAFDVRVYENVFASPGRKRGAINHEQPSSVPWRIRLDQRPFFRPLISEVILPAIAQNTGVRSDINQPVVALDCQLVSPTSQTGLGAGGSLC